jgi:hypothetical protein
MTEQVFFELGLQISRSHESLAESTTTRRLKIMFGVSPAVCSRLYALLPYPKTVQPIHLLYTLLFFKCYPTEHQMHAITGLDEKTSRKYIRQRIGLLQRLNLV